MRIVLVSPQFAERSALQQLLIEDGHDVTSAPTRAEGIELAATIHPDVFVADAQVAGVDGLAVRRALADRGLEPRVLLLCSRAGRASACGGGVDCLTKPIDLGELRKYLAEP